MSRGRGFVVALAASAGTMLAPASAAAEPSVDASAPSSSPESRALAQPDRGYVYATPQAYPSLAWFIVQLIPSPEVAVGRRSAPDARIEAAFGLRWQVTPLLWSWGTNRHASRWRSFVVDPLARHSGSLELTGTVEYFFGTVERAIVRPGVRAYFPLVQRGEYLSMSIGTSTYAYDERMRVAYDVGAYVLWGLFGVQATIAPENGPLTAIGTFRIRYF